MGSVFVTYKVFPEDIVASFDTSKQKIKDSSQIPAIEGWGEEPVAFGLKALLVQIRFPEDEWVLVMNLKKN